MRNEIDDNNDLEFPLVWEWVQLGDIAILENGDRGRNYPSTKDFVKEGIPFINAGHIENQSITRDGMNFITREKFDRLSNGKIQSNDFVFCLRGTLGKFAPVRNMVEGAIASSLVIIRCKDSVIPGFMKAYLSSSLCRKMVQTFDNGAAQPNLSAANLRSFQFPLPPLPTQKKIASVLSAYDDLIENNERRIKILEEMAQSIYREWFVNYRFPGHENVRMVDSELGQIPEGWEVQSVEKSFVTLGGGTPSKKVEEYWDDGDINWYTPTDLTREQSMFMDRSGSQITSLGLNKSSASLFPAESVMMTSRATIGKVSIAASEACTNQGFITCAPNDNFPTEYIYLWLMDNTEQFIQAATGTTFLEIGRRVFREISVKVPDVAAMSSFSAAVKPLMEQIHNQQRQNQKLRQTRDLLLPKLISGELDVEKLDIVVG